MAPSELSLLRKLFAEVREVADINAEAGKDARTLFREFLSSCVNYNAAVSAMTHGSKPPEGDYASDREAWNRELDALSNSRRSAHEAVISNYCALTRICRKHREKDLTAESQYPPNAERFVLGTFALVIRRGLAAAKELDTVLFKQMQQ